MKTKARKFMYIAMLLLVTLALPSCEVDLSLGNHTLEYRERTAYLCSSDWQDKMPTDGGTNTATPSCGTGMTRSTPASG